MPASADGPELGFWRCRAITAEGATTWIALIRSAHHPDDTEIVLPEAEARALVDQIDSVPQVEGVVGRVGLGEDGRIVRVEVTPEATPKSPPLWFVELTEPDASPPATTIVAFTEHGVDEGTLLDRAELRDVDAQSADQLGAIRWYPATGEVDQLYVSPSWRRRGIGTAMIAAASMMTRARGLTTLWGDGQRTADGERMREASLWSDGTADLTHLAPPMTPVDER